LILSYKSKRIRKYRWFNEVDYILEPTKS